MSTEMLFCKYRHKSLRRTHVGSRQWRLGTPRCNISFSWRNGVSKRTDVIPNEYFPVSMLNISRWKRLWEAIYYLRCAVTGMHTQPANDSAQCLRVTQPTQGWWHFCLCMLSEQLIIDINSRSVHSYPSSKTRQTCCVIYLSDMSYRFSTQIKWYTSVRQ
jgi:hypothetical protein